jgi:hypothetical protein
MFNVRVKLVLIGLAEICVPDQVRYLPTLSTSAREKVSIYVQKRYLRNPSRNAGIELHCAY